MTFNGKASIFSGEPFFFFVRAHPGFCMTHTFRSRLFPICVVIVTLLLSLPVEGQLPWKDGLGDHRTRAELDEILRDHNEWLDSKRKGGRNANLSGTDLSYANLRDANLSYATLVRARLITADLAFNRIFFDLTSQYGMNPGRPLLLTLGGSFLCTLIYSLFIHFPGASGVYVVKKRVYAGSEHTKRLQIRSRAIPPAQRWARTWKYPLHLVLREWRLARAAMFFSLMSAFNIGFRGFNFGRWLRMLTKREYYMKAIGWTRTVAGFQSLISVYLIALWVLTYFGRPFE